MSNTHKDMIWGNDAQYAKAEQIRLRQEQLEKHKTLMTTQTVQSGGHQKQSCVEQYIQAQHAKGELVNYFIKRQLKEKTIVARLLLGMVMLVTVMFKHQWVLWIMLVVTYKLYINTERNKAFEADVKWGQLK